MNDFSILLAYESGKGFTVQLLNGDSDCVWEAEESFPNPYAALDGALAGLYNMGEFHE